MVALQLLHFTGKQDIQVKAAGNNPGALPASLAQDCTSAAGSYTNPFAHTRNLIPRRIDMGVDYDGQGEIDALGNAHITFAGTGIGGNWTCNTSTNGGIVYQLSDGPDHGRYIYLTEDLIPTVHTGEQVSAGQQIATGITPARRRPGWRSSSFDTVRLWIDGTGSV